MQQPTWYTPLFRSRPTTFISLVLAGIHPSTPAITAILSAQSSATGAHYLHHATTSVSRKLPRPAAAIACHEGTLICAPSPASAWPSRSHPAVTSLSCANAVLMHPLMQYLLGYLEGISDAPRISDPDFQQLLVDVQASKVSDFTRWIYPAVARQVQDTRSLTRASSSIAKRNLHSFACINSATCFRFCSLKQNRPMHSTTAWRRS